MFYPTEFLHALHSPCQLLCVWNIFIKKLTNFLHDSILENPTSLKRLQMSWRKLRGQLDSPHPCEVRWSPHRWPRRRKRNNQSPAWNPQKEWGISFKVLPPPPSLMTRRLQRTSSTLTFPLTRTMWMNTWLVGFSRRERYLDLGDLRPWTRPLTAPTWMTRCLQREQWPWRGSSTVLVCMTAQIWR